MIVDLDNFGHLFSHYKKRVYHNLLFIISNKLPPGSALCRAYWDEKHVSSIQFYMCINISYDACVGKLHVDNILVDVFALPNLGIELIVF